MTVFLFGNTSGLPRSRKQVSHFVFSQGFALKLKLSFREPGSRVRKPVCNDDPETQARLTKARPTRSIAHVLGRTAFKPAQARRTRVTG